MDKWQPRPPRGRGSRSPRAPKDKCHKTNANASTQRPKGRRRTPQAGRSPRAPKGNHQAQPPKERKTPQHAEGPGHQKTNSNSRDQQQRTSAKHSHQEEEKHNRRGRTTKTAKQKALQEEQKPQTAVDKSLKARNAKTSRQMRGSSQRGTVTLAPAWERGWGVLVGNKPLVPPPGSTPSHEISPSTMAQDPGALWSFLLWHHTAHPGECCWSFLSVFQWMASSVHGTQAVILRILFTAVQIRCPWLSTDCFLLGVVFAVVLFVFGCLFGCFCCFAFLVFGVFGFSSCHQWNDITWPLGHYAHMKLTTVLASLAWISTASKHLHNDLAKAIEALEQKRIQCNSSNLNMRSLIESNSGHGSGRFQRALRQRAEVWHQFSCIDLWYNGVDVRFLMQRSLFGHLLFCGFWISAFWFLFAYEAWEFSLNLHRSTVALFCAFSHWRHVIYQFASSDIGRTKKNDTVFFLLLQSRSLSGRHVSTGFLDPVLGPMMKQVCWHSRRSKAYRGLPEARMAGATVEACGRHRFRRNHPLWEPRMWQGQVWEARPDGESTRGKAKFGKRHGSQVGRRELLNTKASPREGEETAENPLPPIQCATYPIEHPQGGLLSITLYFSNAGNASAAIFWCFSLPQWSFARVLPHPQGHPQASARTLVDTWITMAAFPDLALRRCCLAEIARACNHSSWFKFSSSQYPLENYKLRNMVRFRAILCWGTYPVSTSAIL